MKKLLSVILSVLLLVSSLTCLFTLPASAEASGEVQFTYDYEEESAGIIPYKEVAPESGEPNYPVGNEWGVSAAAGYGVWDSTLTTMTAQVFTAPVYGADGTKIGDQTAQVRSGDFASWNNNVTVVESAGNGNNGSDKYIKVAKADIAYFLGMDVDASSNYELTYYVKTSGNTEGDRTYFSSGIFSSLNFASNSYGDCTATLVAQIPNMLFGSQSYPNTADKAIMGELQKISKTDTVNYSGWTKVTHTFSTPAENVTKVYFAVCNGIDNDGVFLDDISLTKMPFEVDTSEIAVEFYGAGNQKLESSNAYCEVVASPNGNLVDLTVKYTETDAYELIGWYKDGNLVSAEKTITDIEPTEAKNYSVRIEDKNLYSGASYENMEVGSVKHDDQTTHFPTGTLWGGIKTAGYRGQTFAGVVYDKDGNSYNQVDNNGTYSHSGTYEVVEGVAASGNKSLHLNCGAWVYATALENVKAGSEYKLSFKVLANHSNDTARVKLKNAAVVTTVNFGSNTGEFSFLTVAHLANNFSTFGLAVKGGTTVSNSDWTTIELDFTMPETLSALDTLYLVLDTSGNAADIVYDIYVDDISFSEKEVEVNADEIAVEFYNTDGEKIENSNAYGEVTAVTTGSTASLTVNYTKTAAYNFSGWYKDGECVSTNETLTGIAVADATSYSARIIDTNLYTAASYEGYASGTILKHTDKTVPFPINGQWGGSAGAGYRKMTVEGTVYDNQGNAYQQENAGDYSNSVTATVSNAYSHSGENSLYLTGQYWVMATAIENVRPGKSYDLSYWVMKDPDQTTATKIKNFAVTTTVNTGTASTVSGANLYIAQNFATFGLTLDNGSTTMNDIDLSSGDWVEIKTRFTVPANATELDKVYIMIDASGTDTTNAGQLYVDDISVSEVFDGLVTAYNGLAAVRTASASKTGKNGLRVYNKITKEFIEDYNVVEYGSVVSREGKLTESTLTLENAQAKGVAYTSENPEEIFLWSSDDEANVYTAYLTGILKKYYDEPYIIRAYAKTESGAVYYGEELSVSVFDVVNAIDNGNGVSVQTTEDIEGFKEFAGSDDYMAYDKWVKNNLMFAGKLRNIEKAEDTLSGEALTNALEVEGYYEPLFERTIANEGNLALLKSVFKKAQSGEDITIVGFGGSITQKAACTSVYDSYSYLVKEWLQEKFPNITVNYYNAGIGATTSVFGISRMTQQVMSHNPDLVLLDFTTNDQKNDYHAGSYEAILRTLIENDVAVVTVLFGSIVNSEYKATTPAYHKSGNREELHGPVMLYTDVPVIDYYGVMWDCYLDTDGDGYNVETDPARWANLWNDYIHPTEAGHKLVANAINYYLEKVLNKLDEITDEKYLPSVELDKYTEYFMGADMYDSNSEDTASVTITKTEGVTQESYGNVDSTTITHYDTWDIPTGDYIEFTVSKAKMFAFLRVQGTSYGSAEIYVNDVLVSSDNAYSSSSDLNWINFIKFYDGSDTVKVKILSVSGTYRVTKALIAHN